MDSEGQKTIIELLSLEEDADFEPEKMMNNLSEEQTQEKTTVHLNADTLAWFKLRGDDYKEEMSKVLEDYIQDKKSQKS